MTTVGFTVVSPLMAIYAETLGATGIWLGIIFASFSFSRLVVAPPIGLLSDRIGRKKLLALGLVGYTASSLLYVCARDIYTLTIVRFLHGLASAMTFPIILAYVGDISPLSKEGEYMGTIYTAFFLGYAAGPLLGGLLADYYGIHATFYTMSAITFVSFLLVMFMLPETRRVVKPRVAKGIRSRMMTALGIFRATKFMSRAIVWTFLAVYAEALGLSLSEIGLSLTVQMVAQSAFQRPFGKFADRYNKVFVTTLGGLFGALPIIFHSLLPKRNRPSHSELLDGLNRSHRYAILYSVSSRRRPTMV